MSSIILIQSGWKNKLKIFVCLFQAVQKFEPVNKKNYTYVAFNVDTKFFERKWLKLKQNY